MVWGDRERPHSIEIPVRDSNEVVEVFLDELPADPSEIKAIICEEGAPIELFLHFSIEYYYQGRFEEFKYLLREGLTECSKRNERRAEVPLLTALAAFNIALGLGLQPRMNEKNEVAYFEQATSLLNDAERYSQTDMSLLLRKGLLLLAQRKIPQAEYQLKIAVSREPDNVAAHVALGCGAFLAGEWKNSLYEFQTVLKKLPSSSESVRLAIGHCLLRLGNERGAELAFERVLSINPQSSSALTALAILNLNRGVNRNTSNLAKGMQLLKQAYDLDKTNPTVLLHLANHFFFKKDYMKAASLAQSALNYAGDSSLRKSEALYIVGKIHHAQSNWDGASNCFSEAAKLNPNLVLAQLGLGQVCLQRGDISSAVDCFERVVELEKNSGKEICDTEFWVMMGSSNLSDPNRVTGAEKLLQKAIDLGACSYDLFIALALLYETKSPKEAVAAYKKAGEIDPSRFEADVELMNNFAVMLHLNGSLDEASSMLKKALSISAGSELEFICRYNSARLLEDMGKWSEAELAYKDLSQTNPNDPALHLRLGILCSRRGQHNEAAEHYKEAIGIEEGSLDAWVLLASNHLRMKALTPARKAFERILKQHDRHDAFSLVALGTIYVEIGRHERRLVAINDNLRRALEFFIKALQLQPQNHLAANGVGLVLAELGRFKEAKEVFLQVKQAAPSFADAALNLAHCFIELGQYGAAIHAYEALLARSHGQKAAGILLFLSRAHYVQAKEEKNPLAFETAISCLNRAAAILSTNDVPLRFNIALCQQEVAAVMLKRGVVGMTDEDATKAMGLLDAASATFAELGALSPIPDSVDAKVLEQRLKYCGSLRSSLKSRLDALKLSSHTRQAKLEVVRIQREEQLQSERLCQEREAEERRKEQERNEEIRRELAAKFRHTEERVKAAERTSDNEDSSFDTTLRGPKSNESSGNDSESSSSSLTDVERSQRRKRRSDMGKPRKRKMESTIETGPSPVPAGGGEASSEQVPPPKRKRGRPRKNPLIEEKEEESLSVSNPDDENGQDLIIAGRRNRHRHNNRNSRQLSKDIISDSDEDEGEREREREGGAQGLEGNKVTIDSENQNE